MCPVCYYCIRYAKSLSHIVTIFLCIRFQLSFYFIWPHFFTPKVFLHDLYCINWSQAIHYKNYISINGLLCKWILIYPLYCKKHFVLLTFGMSPYCWKLFNGKISWSTVGHMLYIDQGCAGINCSMIHVITYSNHASIFTNKYHAKHTNTSKGHWNVF